MTLYEIFTSALVGASCLMTGCATKRDVVPIGNDNYAIAGSSAIELSSGVRDEVKLIEIANQYCEARGGEATLVSAKPLDEKSGAATFGAATFGAATGVVFRCY